MNRTLLFDYFDRLEKEKQTTLLKLCFDEMNSEQRRNLFSELEHDCISHTQIDGKDVLKRVTEFKEAAINGHYFAPFDINLHIPFQTAH